MSCDYEGSESQPVWVNAVCDGLMGSPGGRGECELVQLCANSLRSRSGDSFIVLFYIKLKCHHHISSVQSPRFKMDTNVCTHICPSRETCSVM